jgi:hypothetical protein
MLSYYLNILGFSGAEMQIQSVKTVFWERAEAMLKQQTQDVGIDYTRR